MYCIWYATYLSFLTMNKWQFELFKTLFFPNYRLILCLSIIFNSQSSFKNTNIDDGCVIWMLVSLKSQAGDNFCLPLLITAFPFICPFGIARHWELLLGLLCSPTRAVWCCLLARWLSVKMHLVWVARSDVGLFALCDGPRFIWCSLTWNEQLSQPTLQASSHPVNTPYTLWIWLGKVWAKGPPMY